MTTELWAVCLTILAGIVGAFGPLMFKKSSKDFSLNPKKLLKNHYFFLGVMFYGLGTVLFVPSLKGGDLSVLYPLIALMYIWVSLLSVKFLGEKMTKLKWAGVLIILLGVTLIGIGS